MFFVTDRSRSSRTHLMANGRVLQTRWRSIIASASAILLSVYPATATMAVSPTASATFCVTVPSILGVSGPAAPLSLTHDGSGGLQTFPLEPFTLLSNQAAGAVVTFDCIGGFIHTTDALLTRDCILGATLDSADATSGWAVDVAADQTHLGDLVPDLTAQVQLSSTAPGDAVMNLEVCMDGGDPALLPPGVYCTVIVATIAAN